MIIQRTEMKRKSFLVEEMGQVQYVFLSVIVEVGELSVFIVDQEGLQKYRGRQPFMNYGPGKLTGRFYRTIGLPHGGPWWLVLHNGSDGIVWVEYGYDAA